MYKLIKTYLVKTWDELTQEEKEKEKEKQYELILEAWQEQQHELFEEEFVEDYCDWKDYEFFDKMEVIK